MEENTLAEEQIISLSNKQQAESEYNSAMANYEGLRKMLQMINIDPDDNMLEIYAEVPEALGMYRSGREDRDEPLTFVR